jgi:hypothetical protein
LASAVIRANDGTRGWRRAPAARDSADEKPRDDAAHRLRGVWSVAAEPGDRPVQRAEHRPRDDGGIHLHELAGTDSVGDDLANRLLVAIAFLDDLRAQRRRQRFRLQMRGGTLDLVQQRLEVCGEDGAQPLACRFRRAAGRDCRLNHPVERAILAVEEQLILAIEVVIQVCGRDIRCFRDISHARIREPALAKELRGGAENAVA